MLALAAIDLEGVIHLVVAVCRYAIETLSFRNRPGCEPDSCS